MKLIEAAQKLKAYHTWNTLGDVLVKDNPSQTELNKAIDSAQNFIKTLHSCNFFTRLESFISNVEVHDLPSEEEKQMIINICKQFKHE